MSGIGAADGQASVRARAPLRLGLAGGGTDLSPYCDEFGGAVLNASIDLYAHSVVAPSADGRVRLAAHDLDLTATCDGGDAIPDVPGLRIHAAVLRRMLRAAGRAAAPPIRVVTHVDAPPGSGLGASSALVVALVEALRGFLGLTLDPYGVARLAFDLERVELRLPGGRQDHYAAAFGGVNFLEFHAGGGVSVTPLRLPRAVLDELEASLVVCFTGVSRTSEHIIAAQVEGMRAHAARSLESLHQLKRDALEMRMVLPRGDIARVAALLNQSWSAKQRTAGGISTPRIETLHEVAMRHGAIGGKVSGAGGGGYMMFIVPPPRRAAVARALEREGASTRPIRLTAQGARSWRC